MIKFDKHVKLPKVCYPLDSIPDAYRQWYKAVLHEGKRLPPPTSSQPVVCIPLQPLKILDSKVLDINKLFKHHQPIGQYWYSSGVGVVRGPGGVALETTQKNTLALSAGTPAVVGFTPKRNHVMVFHHNNHMFNLTTGKEVPITFRADESMCYDGRIYFRNGDQMLEAFSNEDMTYKQIRRALRHRRLADFKRRLEKLGLEMPDKGRINWRVVNTSDNGEYRPG